MLVTDLALTPASEEESPPGFLADSESGPPPRQAFLAAVRTLNRQETVLDVRGDDLAIGVPLYRSGEVIGAVVARRRLTEVGNAVNEVRKALLAAAASASAVAVALAFLLASTLLRRLGRLRAAALRISAEGPDVSMPRDTGHDEVGDLARALARMQEELRRQESARRAFVATASHELRTPLTMLQGTMELLAEDLDEIDPDIPDAQRQVATARRELLRLSTLAEELLDLSRLDAAVALRSEAVELGELARAVAAEFGLRAGERDTAIKVVPPTGPCWGRGDPDAVARVVRILIDNALRYGGRRRHPRDHRRGRHRRGRRPRPRRPAGGARPDLRALLPRPRRAAPRAASASASRSAASSPSAWAARSRSPTARAAARASRSRCRARTAASRLRSTPLPEPTASFVLSSTVAATGFGPALARERRVDRGRREARVVGHVLA